MAKPAAGDPFDRGDESPLHIESGVFSADGPADESAVSDRTGATNARWAKGGAWSRFRSHATGPRRGVYVAVTLLVLMVLVVPMAIGWFANARREALAAQAAETPSPTIVVLSPEAQAIQTELDPIQAAYLMSNGIADQGVKDEMGRFVDETVAAILSDDTGSARTKLDEAVAYFISTYSQSLPARADTILEEYPYSEWETDERIDELKTIIFANSQGQDLSALVAAVIELPQRIGDAMSEHLGNRVTYVPPRDTSPPSTGAPAPSAPSAPPPSDPPPATVSPGGPPGQTNPPGGGGGGGGGGNTDDDEPPSPPTFSSGPGR